MGSTMFSHILIPTDLGDRGDRTIELVRELVAGRDARVTLLHVVQPISQTGPDEFREFYDELEQRSAERLSELAKMLKAPGLDVTQHVIYGNPAIEIARFAEAHDVDLVVLASHRLEPERGGQDWGTVSYKVSMLARCPVLLVK